MLNRNKFQWKFLKSWVAVNRFVCLNNVHTVICRSICVWQLNTFRIAGLSSSKQTHKQWLECSAIALLIGQNIWPGPLTVARSVIHDTWHASAIRKTWLGWVTNGNLWSNIKKDFIDFLFIIITETEWWRFDDDPAEISVRKIASHVNESSRWQVEQIWKEDNSNKQKNCRILVEVHKTKNVNNWSELPKGSSIYLSLVSLIQTWTQFGSWLMRSQNLIQIHWTTCCCKKPILNSIFEMLLNFRIAWSGHQWQWNITEKHVAARTRFIDLAIRDAVKHSNWGKIHMQPIPRKFFFRSKLLRKLKNAGVLVDGEYIGHTDMGQRILANFDKKN